MTTPDVAALYIRVSTDHQRENWSVQDQRGLARLGVERQMEVVVYDEQGVSGETIEARPTIQRLLADIELGQPVGLAGGRIRAVITVDWNRLSRDEDVIDGLKIKKVLKDNGVLLITPSKTYDFAVEMDSVFAQLELMFAANQKQKLVKTTTRGWYAKARAECRYPEPTCGFTGGVSPLGYRIVRDIPHRDGRPRARLDIDPAEAALVQRIYALYVDGVTNLLGAWQPLTIRAVAETLNLEGTRLPVRFRQRTLKTGVVSILPEGRMFRSDDIRRVLEHRVYLGFVTRGEGHLSKWVRDDGPAEVNHPHLRIIDVTLFNRATAQRQERAKRGRGACTTRPLAGVLQCPYCHGPMVSSQSSTRYKGKVRVHFSYTCLAYRQSGRARCAGYTIAESLARRAVEALLLDHLRALPIDHALDLALRERASYADKTITETLRAELLATEARLDRLVRAVTEGTFTPAEARTVKLEVLERQEHLTKRLAKLDSRALAEGEWLNAVAAIVTKLDERIHALDPARFQSLARLIVSGVVLAKEGRGQRWQAHVVRYQPTPLYLDMVAKFSPLNGAAAEAAQSISGAMLEMALTPVLRVLGAAA